MNRAQFVNLLAASGCPQCRTWTMAPLGIGASRGRGLRHRWSSVAMAKAYPDARVDGFDLDRPRSSSRARRAVEGVTDRVDFQVRDAADPELADRYE